MLRESDSIEQDADRVCFLHKDNGGYEFIVDKHRHGDTGVIPIGWEADRVAFSDSNSDSPFSDYNCR